MLQKAIYYNSQQFYILRITDEHIPELFELLRKNLVDICYGPKNRIFDPKGATYTKACTAIIALIENPPTNTREYGVIAEILMHILAPICLGPNFQSISLLLSLQDRNIKHGFDLNFAQKEKRLIWYGEVKSGKERKRSELLRRACNSLKDNFLNIDNADIKKNTSSKWDAAKNEVLVKFLDRDALPLHKLLSDDQECNIKNPAANKRNAIFMTVNYGNTGYDEALNTKDIEYIQRTAKEEGFDRVAVISIHKKIFSDIIAFFKNDGNIK